MESVTGTRTANESASRSYQLAQDINERKNEALSKAAETRISLDRDFYSYVGQQKFGGGAAGDRQAIKYLEGLPGKGKTDEIDKLREQYYQARGINAETLAQGLPDIKKPDVQAITEAVAPVDGRIDTTNSELKQELHNQPNLKTHDPSKQVAAQLQAKPGTVDPKEIQQGLTENKPLISEGKDRIEDKGHEIKQTPVERLHSAAAEAGKRSGELTLQAADAWNNSVPGQITNGLADAVPKVADGLNTLPPAGPKPKSQSDAQMLAKQVAAPAQQEQKNMPEVKTSVPSVQTPPKGGL